MDTIFIINPKAGQGKNIDNLIEKITSAGAKVYVTKSIGDAENFVRDYCLKNGTARFIACGGDGTFNEVLNGIANTPATEIGVMPLGTGNDFCRNFEGDFSDVHAQLSGNTIKCDAIRYTTNGTTRMCANMFNIGFDCNVADLTATMKKKPLISGSLAYFISILATLVKKKGADIEVTIDGEDFHDSQLLLTSLANGKFCGGGIMSNPLSDVTDGYIDINVICDVPRRKFVTLLPHYMKGTHLGLKNIDKVIYNTKCKKVTLTPKNCTMRLCCDGEIQDAGTVEFEIAPEAFNFVVPKK